MGFRSCVVKLTAFCNLDCTYCYVFNLGDTSYKGAPRHMPVPTALLLLDRIEEHLVATGERSFSLTLHGGEPTLWPLASFEALFARLAGLRQRGFQIEVGMQTNAYRVLPPALLRLLDEHGVTLGVSLDGPAAHNDRVRVDHAGRGSYRRVLATVTDIIERGYEHLLGGFLTVADPDLPAAQFLSWVRTLPVTRIDVLWPIGHNYNEPPWREGEEERYRERPRYGAWFAELFRLWWDADDPEIYIRSFFQVVQLHLGSTRHIDALVNDRYDMFVVDTDGTIAYPDYLRIGRDGAARSSYTVVDATLAEVAQDPVFRELYVLGDHVPPACTGCPHVSTCGGGFLAGRTSRRSLLEPGRSVLCHDQFAFLTAVAVALDPGAQAASAPLRPPLQVDLGAATPRREAEVLQ